MFFSNDLQRQHFIESFQEWEVAKTPVLNVVAYRYTFESGATFTANDYRECEFLIEEDRIVKYTLSIPDTEIIAKRVSLREMIDYLKTERLDSVGVQLSLF